jgi:acyl-CoA synthetase (AMP-forming)/AMP-acid ligase II
VPRNLVEMIRRSVARHGENRHYTFVRHTADGIVEDRRTFADLDRRARDIAEHLRHQVAPGSRALLVYPEGPEFLEAFLGCLYAQVLAVPAPVSRYRSSMHRLASILVDADIPIVLTTEEAKEDLVAQIAEASLTDQVRMCVATDACAGDAGRWQPPELAVGSIAYLQYTSGSTSEPKGVMVSHGNLVHNIGTVCASLWGLDDRDVMVAWLPHFHDMGLIAMLLAPLCLGGSCAYFAPLSFVKRPVHWLHMISRYRATATIAPDFAYELVTRSVSDGDLVDVDLSTLRLAANGSEPVRVSTVEAFARRFAVAGLRPEAHTPSYGLAEATLLVAAGNLGAAPTVDGVHPGSLERHHARRAPAPGTGLRVVGHGRTEGFELKIVAPDTLAVLGDGRVGEIWLRGPSVALGYWNRQDATEGVFRARTAAGDGPYLRTGDLAFILDGELFIVGRLKDVIVVQGRNLYPQDIEQVVRGVHPALEARSGAAFSVAADRERVVVVQEVKRATLRDTDLAELTARVRQAVVTEFDVSFPSVVMVERPVPRTTSGKVQRSSTRTLFLTNGLASIYEELEPSVLALRERRPAGG